MLSQNVVLLLKLLTFYPSFYIVIYYVDLETQIIYLISHNLY